MLRNVSRTFALSIEQLPHILREAVAVAYLLFRIADCLEDHPELPPQKKAALLRLWAHILQGKDAAGSLTGAIASLDGTDPEVYVAQHAGEVLTQLNRLPAELKAVLTSNVTETSLGMARWQEHDPSVQDEVEMDDYMHEVAGRVGYLLTDIFAWYCPAIHRIKNELMPLGREFGLALQTVNIIRGVRKDFERGWVFVPASFYTPLGLTRESLFDPAHIDKAVQVINRLADKAERHLLNGLRYTTMLPRLQRSIRLFCLWPLLFAVQTLAVSRSNPAVLSAEAKITRKQVRQIVFSTRFFFWSNTLTARYYRALSRTDTA